MRNLGSEDSFNVPWMILQKELPRLPMHSSTPMVGIQFWRNWQRSIHIWQFFHFGMSTAQKAEPEASQQSHQWLIPQYRESASRICWECPDFKPAIPRLLKIIDLSQKFQCLVNCFKIIQISGHYNKDAHGFKNMGFSLAEGIVVIHRDRHTMCLSLSRCNLLVQNYLQCIKIIDSIIGFDFTIKNVYKAKVENTVLKGSCNRNIPFRRNVTIQK